MAGESRQWVLTWFARMAVIFLAAWLAGQAGTAMRWLLAVGVAIVEVVLMRSARDAALERADRSYPLLMNAQLRASVEKTVRDSGVELEQILLPSAVVRNAGEDMALWIPTGWRRGYLALSGRFKQNQALVIGAAATQSARGYLHHQEATETRVILAASIRAVALGLLASQTLWLLPAYLAVAFVVLAAERASERELGVDADIRAAAVIGYEPMRAYLIELNEDGKTGVGILSRTASAEKRLDRVRQARTKPPRLDARSASKG